jgi:hypothetical protein
MGFIGTYVCIHLDNFWTQKGITTYKYSYISVTGPSKCPLSAKYGFKKDFMPGLLLETYTKVVANFENPSRLAYLF